MAEIEEASGSNTHREITLGGKEEVEEIGEAGSMSAMQKELEALKAENKRLQMEAEITKLREENAELQAAETAADTPPPAEATVDDDFSSFKSPGGREAFLKKVELTEDAFEAEEDFSSFRSPGGKEAMFIAPAQEVERVRVESAALEQAIARKNAQFSEQVAIATSSLNKALEADAAAAAQALASTAAVAKDSNPETNDKQLLGMCPLVVECLGGFLSDAAVAAEGCKAVCFLSRGGSCMAKLDEEGVGTFVVGAMKKHTGTLAVQEAAAKAVVNITSRLPINPPHLNESGELIVKAMGAFGAERNMQLWGAMALKNMAHNDNAADIVPTWGEAAVELMSTTALRSRWAEDVDLNKTTLGATGIIKRALKSAKQSFKVVKACLYRKSAKFEDRLPEHPDTTLMAGVEVSGIVLPGAEGIEFLQVEVDTGNGRLVWCYVPMTDKQGGAVLEAI